MIRSSLTSDFLMWLFCFSIFLYGLEQNEAQVNLNRWQIEEAAQAALKATKELDELEKTLLDEGLSKGNSANFHTTYFRMDPELLRESRNRGFFTLEMTKYLRNKFNLTSYTSANQITGEFIEAIAGQPICEPVISCESSKYRTADASCNNLKHPSWGKSFTPFLRRLPPAYDDGFDKPRTKGVDGSHLPNVRVVSTTISPDVERDSRKFTELLAYWGQFVAHDISLGAINFGIDCCRNENEPNKSMKHPECFHINIPADDPFYSQFGERCMHFQRTVPAADANCYQGVRLQLNAATGIIDGSLIYGSTSKDATDLRSFVKGKLRSYIFEGEVPPPDYETLCNTRPYEKPCFKAGDIRVNDTLLLSVMHVIWLREHNRLAGILARINPHWDDETLYQEARRIVAAMMQHIAYHEYLPSIFDVKKIEEYGLRLQREGFFYGYKESQDITPSSVFTVAAHRFGHTMIQGHLNLMGEDRRLQGYFQLKDHYSRPVEAYEEDVVHKLILGFTSSPAQRYDTFLTDGFTNHLFQLLDKDFGMDLFAINIQRGRDHGLPGYRSWRQYCNLQDVQSFDDLYQYMIPRSVELLRSLYRNVADIDLYVAGLSEIPENGNIFGPVFTCLIGKQYNYFKFGDRFWYENGGMDTSFTAEQLSEIRKVTLARVLCDNSAVQSMQKKSLLLPGTKNPVVPCIGGSIPRMNMEAWRDLFLK